MTLFYVVAYLPNLSFKFFPYCGFIIRCILNQRGVSCGVGCSGNCRHHLRICQIQRPFLALFHRLTFEREGISSHRAAKNRVFRTICRVARFVLKLHGDVIAPNGVKHTFLLIALRPCSHFGGGVGVPYDIANLSTRLIKLVSLGIGGFCAPPGKRLAGGGGNSQVLRFFQRAGFLIQHVRARRVVLIYIFLAAYTVVDHIGNALFIARDVAIADIAVIIRVRWRTGQFTRIHTVVRQFIVAFFLSLGDRQVFVCTNSNIFAGGLFIVEIAVFDMVQAQLKVDAIGELVPIVIAITLPEPIRPILSIYGYLHIHMAADSPALVAAGVFTIVICSAVHIQPVPLVF